jgi:hypothetical protein
MQAHDRTSKMLHGNHRGFWIGQANLSVRRISIVCPREYYARTWRARAQRAFALWDHGPRVQARSTCPVTSREARGLAQVLMTAIAKRTLSRQHCCAPRSGCTLSVAVAR